MKDLECLLCGKIRPNPRAKYCSIKCAAKAREDSRNPCVRCLALCGFGSRRIARRIGLTKFQAAKAIRRHGLQAGRYARQKVSQKLAPPWVGLTTEAKWRIMGSYRLDAVYWRKMANLWTRQYWYNRVNYYYLYHEERKQHMRLYALKKYEKIKTVQELYQALLTKRKKYRIKHPDRERAYRFKYTQSDKHTIWKYRNKFGFSSNEEIPHEMVEIMKLQRKINQEVSRQQGARMPTN